MNKMKSIFMGTDPRAIDYVYSDEQKKILRELVDLDPEVRNPDSFGKVDLSCVEAIFSTWGMPSLSVEQLAEYLPDLKIVFYAAGATDFFARPMFERGIQVISGWRANAIPVAEFAVAQIMLGLKNYFALARSGHSRETWYSRPKGPGAYGATVSLIGCGGAIATRMMEMLKQYQVNVIGIPSPPAERTMTLEEAFKVSQVVSSHLPDRDDNAGCLNGAMFESMPQNAVFINTGRGRQVNEPELIAALKKRPDLTALLDVTFPEPPEPDSELYTLPNVFLTPHIAGSLNDEVHRMADYILDDLRRYLSGEPLQYQVQESMLLTSGQK